MAGGGYFDTLIHGEKGELGLPGTVNEEEPNVPTFYSKVQRLVDEKVQNRASGDSILATLRNNGAKENELEAMELEPFLKGKDRVSKSELQDYVRQHQINLGETTLGGRTVDPVVESNFHTLRESLSNAARYEAQTGKYLVPDLTGTYHEVSPAGAAILKGVADGTVSPKFARMTSPQLDKPIPSEILDMADKYGDLYNQMHIGREQITPPKYERWTLDGPKENYTEKLITLGKQNPRIDELNAELQTAVQKRELAREEWQRAYGELQRWQNDHPNESHIMSGDDVNPDYRKLIDNYHDLDKSFNAQLNKIHDLHQELSDLSTGDYESSHWDQKNILAHTRYDDRVDLDGKKNLFLEEVQSDWHQEGKHDSYKGSPEAIKQAQVVADAKNEIASQLHNDLYEKRNNPGTYSGAERLEAYKKYLDARDEAWKAQSEYDKLNTGTPNAPYKGDWHELVMKRMLREAAEKGYDRLSWTTGDQQADRYDLSKHISSVEYDMEDNQLIARDPNGRKVVEESVDPKEEEIARYIGAEPARKLVQQIEAHPGRISAESYYDSIAERYHIKPIEDADGNETGEYGVFDDYYSTKDPLTSFDSESSAERYMHRNIMEEAQSLADEGQEPNPKLSGLDLKTGGEWARTLYDKAIPNFMNKYLKKFGVRVGTTTINTDKGPQSVHSIDITPAMKKEFLKKGQPIAQNQDRTRKVLAGAEYALA